MGKSKKSGGTSADRRPGKSDSGLNKTVKSEPVAEARKPAAPAQVAQVTEQPAVRPFDVTAYLKSMAWVYPVALLMLIVLMFYFRAIPSHDSVFTDWPGNYVNIAQDDAVYQMRLVYNTLAHFPERVFYDPFTHYPIGSPVHFGPMFTLIIATASLILGLGNPDTALVAAVGAYTPPVLGALCAIPTYFISKKLFGRNIAIVATATLALLPGQFMLRSLLGFTDHHIAEVLFSATAIMFLVYALDAAKKSNLDFGKLKAFDRSIASALVFSALAGITFGVYMLTWSGGLLIGFVLFTYFVIQAVIDHLSNRNLEYLVIIAAALFVIPSIMLVPYALGHLKFELMFYSLTQPVFLTMAFVALGIIYGISCLLKNNKSENWKFPVVLAGTGILGLLVTYVVMPNIFSLIMAGFNVFAPSGGMLWVAEAQPSYLDQQGNLNLSALWAYFLWTFPLSVVALFMLTFRTIKDNRPAEWLFLIWNLIILWASLSQIRFTYYYAVNAALLTGYFAFAVFKAFDWDKFAENWKKRVTTVSDAKVFVTKNSGPTLVFSLLGVLFLGIIVFPATSMSTGSGDFFDGVTEQLSKASSGMGYEWYYTLLWMKNNTPDPQGSIVSPSFDYDRGKYVQPGDSDRYDYPSSAYGVMSWWDYGHIITYVAHRAPNANPFQAGIIEDNGTGGSAKFFLATSEADGYANLQNLGSRYVVIDNQMATSKFYAITVWADDMNGWSENKDYTYRPNQNLNLQGDSRKFKNSMMNRLYYEDCNDMGHFRLVYESPGNYYIKVNQLFADSSVDRSGQASVSNYTTAYDMYRGAINVMPYTTTTFLYDARPPVKWVKVFEVVKGATITGHAEPGAPVTATVNLSIGEKAFQYTRKAVADQNGVYCLTVSYPTEAMKGTDYSYDVMPTGKYNLTAGNTTVQVDVPERAVINGETVTVS